MSFGPQKGQIGLVILEKRFFKNFINVFSLFYHMYLLVEKDVIKREFLQPRMIWAKFGWNLPCGSGGKC